MKNTIEFLKNAGIIEKIQGNFAKTKPPVGTSDNTLTSAIKTILHLEVFVKQEQADGLFDAFFKDAAEAVKAELNIEYCDKDEFKEDVHCLMYKMVDFLFEKRRKEKGEE